MASQYGTTRVYSQPEEELGNPAMTQCPLCNVNVVPRGIVGSRMTDTSIGTHCPNCGHIFTPARPANPSEGRVRNAGIKQVITDTVVGSISTAGTAKVIVTGNLVPSLSKQYNVAVALADTPTLIAGKVAAALQADAILSNMYVITNPVGAPTTVVITAVDALANDSTFALSIDNGTCAGMTKSTSVTTVLGIARTFVQNR